MTAEVLPNLEAEVLPNLEGADFERMQAVRCYDG